MVKIEQEIRRILDHSLNISMSYLEEKVLT